MTDYDLQFRNLPGDDCEAISKFFGDKTNGVFVDIGAFDGIGLSNTRPLWLKGWSGFMVEADSRAFEQLSRNYAGAERIKLIHAAISNVEEDATFYESKGSCVFSTMDDRWVKEMGVDNFTPRKIRTRTLGSLGLPDRFDLLTIDVEGMDSAIIESMPNSMWPTLIIAEVNKADGSARIDSYLTGIGYSIAWGPGQNVAYKL